MSEDQLFVDLKMWVVEDEENDSFKLKYIYKLPELKDDFSIEVFSVFLETLSEETAKRVASDDLFNKLIKRTNEDTEKEDDSKE